MYPRITVDTGLLLSGVGVLDRENAQICGVSISAIRHWRYGSCRSAQTQARAPSCPRCDGTPLDEAAYAYLLGLYLGDGCITRGRRDVFALSVACSDDWPGLIAAAGAAMSAVMPASGVFRVQRVGCTEVKSTSKHWRACSRSTALAESTFVRSNWSRGSRGLSRHSPVPLPGACFTQTAAAS
jgi:hypothetical protein